MAAASGADPAQLHLGRQVYITSCTGCHALYRTDAFDRAGWAAAVREMAPKAHLSGADSAALLAYLQAAAR